MQNVSSGHPSDSSFRKGIVRFRYAVTWLTVRPRRWFFGRCLWRGSYGTKWLPTRREEWDDYDYNKDRKRTELEMIEWPNVHWRFAYLTVFRFFKWLHYNGCWEFAFRGKPSWDGIRRKQHNPVSRLVQRIGETTAGVHILSMECYHCASKEGWQGELAEDETGTTFILEDSGTTATMDGTDHWFRGTTICPKCGYRAEYREGSL